MIQESFKRRFKQVSSFKRGSRISPGSFKKILKKLKALVRVFKGCSVFESFLLHVTHRSYASRRRACASNL